MAANNFTEDGRRIIHVYSFGYDYTLIEAKKRVCRDAEFVFPQPNFLGNYNFGLRSCKKMTTYKLNKLKYQRNESVS